MCACVRMSDTYVCMYVCVWGSIWHLELEIWVHKERMRSNDNPWHKAKIGVTRALNGNVWPNLPAQFGAGKKPPLSMTKPATESWSGCRLGFVLPSLPGIRAGYQPRVLDIGVVRISWNVLHMWPPLLCGNIIPMILFCSNNSKLCLGPGGLHRIFLGFLGGLT